MIKDHDLDRYQKDIVAFAEEQFYIVETKKPIQLLSHQRRILRDVFTADKNGKFPFQTIVYSAVKKSGKTTAAALICLWFALTQEPPNEIYVVANDLEQSVGRVFKSIERAIRMNPYLKEATKITGNTILFKSTGTVVTALASEYAGAAGSNHGLTCWDELWGYTSENSRRLFDELTPVPTRLNSLRLITTYAGWEGESELLMDIYKKGLKGKELYQDLPVRTAKNLYFYWDHVPRMLWQTEEYYEQQREDLRPNAFIRLHTNTWTTNEETFIDLSWWDDCTLKDHRPLIGPSDNPLFVGVDASTKRDSAAVVATFFDYSESKVILAKHRIWQPSPKEPLDLEATMEAYLLDLYNNYPLALVRYDPFQFHRSAMTLKSAGLPMEEYPQTSPNLTAMGQNLYELIKHKNLVIYQDEELRKQASQAVAIESSRGWRIAKERTSHKIDVVVALAMSALSAVPEEGWGPVLEEEIPFEQAVYGDELDDGEF